MVDKGRNIIKQKSKIHSVLEKWWLQWRKTSKRVDQKFQGEERCVLKRWSGLRAVRRPPWSQELVDEKERAVWISATVVQSHSYAWLCSPMDCSMPGLPVLHHHPELAQTHAHWVSDAIPPSHPLPPPSPPASSLSQHQGLSQWLSSSNQVAEVLELQLQHQSFQWIFRTDFL